MATERFPVESTHIMMFARAVGDLNPLYHDAASPEAEAAGGVVAPPTFAMAAAQFDPANPLIPRPGEPWFGSGDGPGFPREGGTGGLHAEQIFEYHQPMRPGMTLTASSGPGRTWEKESKRGGLLKFTETVTEYRVVDSGELVVTATMVGVMTERPVEQEG